LAQLLVICESGTMSYTFMADGLGRLDAYFDRIGRVLGRRDRREAFAIYATGLLGESERKSVEPIAAASCGRPDQCRALTERLLHFVGESGWDDRGVRLCGARYAIAEMVAHGSMESWIFDDTGFIKQGDRSPGVQRQYTGSAGKTTNCQIGVSLTVTTRTIELPVDMDLYLPESWADDRDRCRAAHIPDDVGYRPKWRIALDLAERAVDAGYPPGLVLGDCAFGDVGDFRDGICALGLDYALDVKVHTRVQVVCGDGSMADTMSVAEVADVLGARSYRQTTWREGTRKSLHSRFAAVRVRVVTKKGVESKEHWLVIERPDPLQPPTHYVLCTLPKSTTRKQLVRRIKQRWRIERTYEDMKGEFGLDHFEGRSYRGWQHHVSVVLACYAFVVGERARAFPPEARGSQDNGSIATAA
jgi:SRSO17 transposase